MADINSRLKRALDGPGPQHKVAGQEAFEFSEGSDGALHVKDAGVTTELAAIKDTQAEIISALAATNAKLEGTINTQVTGSNVEDYNALPVKAISQTDYYNLTGNRKKIINRGAVGEFDESMKEIGNVITDIRSNDTYKHVYSAYAGAYAGNNVHIGYASSSDVKGEKWIKHGKLNLGRSSEDPFLVKVEETFYLYVEDKEEVPFRGIRLYTSSDMVNWIDEGLVLDKGAPGEWDEQDVSSPAVLYEDGVFNLFFEGRANGASQGGAVGLATSTDGKIFTKHEANPVVTGVNNTFKFDATISWAYNIVSDDIKKIGDTYHMTVHAYPYSGTFAVVVLTSPDLIEWTDLFEKPLEMPESVFEADGGTVQYSPAPLSSIFYANGRNIYKADIQGTTPRQKKEYKSTLTVSSGNTGEFRIAFHDTESFVFSCSHSSSPHTPTAVYIWQYAGYGSGIYATESIIATQMNRGFASSKLDVTGDQIIIKIKNTHTEEVTYDLQVIPFGNENKTAFFIHK